MADEFLGILREESVEACALKAKEVVGNLKNEKLTQNTSSSSSSTSHFDTFFALVTSRHMLSPLLKEKLDDVMRVVASQKSE
jgi:hypothetical protein